MTGARVSGIPGLLTSASTNADSRHGNGADWDIAQMIYQSLACMHNIGMTQTHLGHRREGGGGR